MSNSHQVLLEPTQDDEHIDNLYSSLTIGHQLPGPISLAFLVGEENISLTPKQAQELSQLDARVSQYLYHEKGSIPKQLAVLPLGKQNLLGLVQLMSSLVQEGTYKGTPAGVQVEFTKDPNVLHTIVYSPDREVTRLLGDNLFRPSSGIYPSTHSNISNVKRNPFDSEFILPGKLTYNLEGITQNQIIDDMHLRARIIPGFRPESYLLKVLNFKLSPPYHLREAKQTEQDILAIRYPAALKLVS